MHHQREKYMLVSFISLGLAIIIGIIAILKSHYFFILFSFSLLAISLISDALFLNSSFRQMEGLKQFIRGAMLFILITYLLLYFLKNL